MIYGPCGLTHCCRKLDKKHHVIGTVLVKEHEKELFVILQVLLARTGRCCRAVGEEQQGLRLFEEEERKIGHQWGGSLVPGKGFKDLAIERVKGR